MQASQVTPNTACNGLKRPPASITWTFVVSGDSRNCGDVIVPTIAADALKHSPEFYWHLGDYRIRAALPDEDMQCGNQTSESSCKTSFGSYLQAGAWKDFEENQIQSFGTTPVVLGIGNHEMIRHKNRDDFVRTFSCWLDAPLIKAQRLKDNSGDQHVRTYYHWLMGGVDFINLDNAGKNGLVNFSPRGNRHLSFSDAEVVWLERLLMHDRDDPAVKSLVLGVHAALPDSFSLDHSMNESGQGIASGRRVYNDLWNFQQSTHKHVNVIASHSHYYMENLYNTEYWRSQGKVLDGWIVGTAGARRYALPKDRKGSKGARTNVYGYLLGTVNPDGIDEGKIKFEFHTLSQDQVPKNTSKKFKSDFVTWCFKDNSACKRGDAQCEPDELIQPAANPD
jgi:hypothetical protein